MKLITVRWRCEPAVKLSWYPCQVLSVRNREIRPSAAIFWLAKVIPAIIKENLINNLTAELLAQSLGCVMATITAGNSISSSCVRGVLQRKPADDCIGVPTASMQECGPSGVAGRSGVI